MPRRRQRTHTQSSDSDSSQKSIQNKKSKKVKTSQKDTASTINSQIIDDAINTVVNNSQVSDTSVLLSDTEANDNDRCQQLENQVKTLSVTVQKQTSEIENLKSQISFILSYIGIDESIRLKLPLSIKANTPMMNHVSDGSDSSTIERTDNANVSTSVNNNSAADNLCMTTNNSKTNSPVINGSSTLCQSVVTAMYVDQKQKDRRSNTFIITGLPVENDIDDKTKVQKICKMDIGVDIDTNIVNVRRLGKPSTDKLQPVLVILKEKQLAQQIIQKAKLLRQSSSAYIRQTIYINQNLTRAEATAAYLVRCQRREFSSARAVAATDPNSHVSQNSTSAPLTAQFVPTTDTAKNSGSNN